LADFPTAVFVCNDMMAIGLLKKAREYGLRIPEDLSIVGFDNIEFSAAVSPALTTIAQPVKELSVVAAERLIGNIKCGVEHRESARIILDPQLIVRDSCQPLKSDKSEYL
jgi:LacI family transcriptional regulator